MSDGILVAYYAQGINSSERIFSGLSICIASNPGVRDWAAMKPLFIIERTRIEAPLAKIIALGLLLACNGHEARITSGDGLGSALYVDNPNYVGVP